MRSLRSWVPALAVAGSLSFHASLLFAQTGDEDLRKEVQELRQKLERLERRLEQQPESTTPQAATPAAGNAGQSSTREQALQQKADDLDQQVRILGRKQEIQQEEKAAEKEKEKSAATLVAGPQGFGIKSADNAFKLNFKGVLQVDSRFYNGTRASSPPVPAAQTPDTFLIRRARPIIEGTLYDKYDFRLMPDFGVGKQQLFDAYLQASFLPEIQLRTGKFKSPFGLEQLQEDVNLTFAERSLVTDLVPNRDVGAQLQGGLFSDTLSYQVGVFNGEPDGTTQADIDSNSGMDIEARVFAKPFKNGSLAPLRGLGAGLAYTTGRQTGSTTTSNLPTYVTPGQQALFGYNAGAFANGGRQRISPQAYYCWGPFGALAEYVRTSQAATRAGVTRDINNTGWHVNIGWVLTGEDAGFDGVTPDKPFVPGTGGWGTFQVVARYSHLSVDDDAFIGSAAIRLADPAASAREAKDTGIGLNWYISKYVRVYFDYDETKFTGGAAGGADRPNEKVFISRFQIAF